MTESPNVFQRPGRALALILAGYLLLATTLSVTIPLGEAPDEVSHYAYLSELRFRGQLPAAAGAAIGEAHQPPLYYLLVVGVTSWLPDGERPILANPAFDLSSGVAPNLLLHPRAETWPYSSGAALWHAWRLVSVLLGLITVVATYLLSRALVPHDPCIALLAASLLAFLPSFLLISAVVNNDNLVVALSALTLLQWARMAASAPTRRSAAVLGALLGLAALAKMPGLLLWPVVGAGFAWQAKDRQTRHAWMKSGVIAVAIGLAVMAPWIIYNAVVFQDPFAWSRFMNITSSANPIAARDAQSYLGSMFTSLAGRFGGASHLRLPDGLYLTVGAVALAALVGLVRPGRWGGSVVLSTAARRALLASLAFAALLAAAQFRIMMFILGMDHARHVFPGLPGVAVAGAIGLGQLARRMPAALVTAAAVMPVAAIVAVISVSSAYSPTVLTLPPQPNSMANIADFGGQIRLAQARLSKVTVQAGESITVHAEWQALSQPAAAYYLQLRLSLPGAEDDPVAVSDSVPDSGRTTTDRWPAGSVYRSDHRLVVPPSVAPGQYDLRLGLRPTDSWSWLQSGGQDSVSIGLIQITAPTALARSTGPTQPPPWLRP